MAFDPTSPNHPSQSGEAAMNAIKENFLQLRKFEAGAAAPGNTVAGMVWYDTGNGLIKRRNSGNTAWNIISAVDRPLPFWIKGADIVSAAALTLGSDGNYFDVTTSNAITSINTVGVGALRKLHFDTALMLTHHATNLVLPGGASIITAVGDEAEFFEEAIGKWRCTNYTRADGTAVIHSAAQLVNTQTGALQSTTAIITLDDSKPQIGEGKEIMTLAITPKNAANKLIIDVVLQLGVAGTGTFVTAALFQDSGADALEVKTVYIPATGQMKVAVLRYYMIAGTTSSTTFKVRFGTSAVTTVYLNGSNSGRKFGGADLSSITITETKP